MTCYDVPLSADFGCFGQHGHITKLEDAIEHLARDSRRNSAISMIVLAEVWAVCWQVHEIGVEISYNLGRVDRPEYE